MILIVASNKDVASLNIAVQALKHHVFVKTPENFQANPIYETILNGRKIRLVTLNEESIFAQSLGSLFANLELIVFISRHSSESGTPTLSVHTPGNVGKSQHGGVARKVSLSPANTMRDALQALMRLKTEMKLEYQVTYEATHHGPSLDLPAMFVELGSSPKQWNDMVAAKAVACASIEAVTKFGNYQAKAVLGLGGTHYNSKFTKIALEDEVAFGHMIPKHAIRELDVVTLRQCLERTLEKVDRAILDWKGIKSEDKLHLVGMLDKIGLPYEKV